MPKGKPIAGKRAIGEAKPGPKPLPPGQTAQQISVRLEPEIAAKLREYQSEIEGHSRSSTINEALRFYLKWQDLETDDYEQINTLLKSSSP